MVSIKYLLNINQELFKVEYFIKLIQYFGNFAEECLVVWPYDRLCKVSKILAEFNKVINFEKFLIYVLPNFNWNFVCASCYLNFWIANVTQNVYNGKFSNVNNEFYVTNVTN